MPSRPASAYLLSMLRLNLMLAHGIVPDLNRQTPSCQSRVYEVTQLRTDGVHCREFAGTGLEILKVLPAAGAAFASSWTT